MTKEMLRKKRIGVLMGGISPEREISLKTGKAIARALADKGYQTCAIDVDRTVVERLVREQIDIAFIALHGPWGEDGTIQGLLELMEIPYTGSGVLGSALAMNKEAAKTIFSYHQLPTPRFQVFCLQDDVSKITIPVPAVVKPVSGGSTIGTSVVRADHEFKEALEKAAEYDHAILIEEYVEGSDITVGILDGEYLPVVEIVPKSGFYDYESKYLPGKTEYIVPARLPREVAEKAQEMAVVAYRVLHCSGAARVDFLVERTGGLMILEINTVPGLTETSLLPMAAAEAGIDFPTLVERMLFSAQLHIT
ncbi:MAG: D-alanine--D-alanine ligase [Deltaproteobacteria bacterium]|nr:D-alanine--D-alanine ligase [Deltaproteobacteria bacterium]